jgi:hypothetical protein
VESEKPVEGADDAVAQVKRRSGLGKFKDKIKKLLGMQSNRKLAREETKQEPAEATRNAANLDSPVIESKKTTPKPLQRTFDSLYTRGKQVSRPEGRKRTPLKR